ncbi:TPA_asm: tail fiber assembly protein [Salmonella enterica subsp. enterica serovar Typhimurium]|uniref:Tail fiber assembly protein n=6 Tax=Salmonella enterica TaxID=28901 RepID=A0A3Y0W6B2_SALET|nr:tail fiber assembly protein [Salmonella enterica]EAC0767593.1 tail fiber assembly protein [Salmonella enterica subsp. enterica serovar Typhimurium str. UK-1]HAB6849577.1 tail fiber assembly protein [Salmonella enterica subsp. enterica]HAD6476885.1 tail fiber assembly protein [Salmonella enterica subsp. enterica serovar Typhimurium str. SL1344]HAE0161260.1 tail fiber assembly protein [Salmonella enterica subsp. enterica serovar Enteritidis str. P125109]HCG3785818.1 tail fiber assembly protei
MVYRTRGNGIMKKYQDIKNFRLIDAPVNRDKTQTEINIGAYFLESDDGQDWYECQSLFSDDTAKIMYDHEGVIWGVVNKPVPQRGNTYSVSMLWPVNMSVAEIDAADCPDDCRGDGSWLYRDGKVLPVPVDYQAKAETTRQKLLNDADNAIKDWRTELTLGIISDENKATLIMWMNYINVLKSLDLTGVSDEATFTAIRWPSLPQE